MNLRQVNKKVKYGISGVLILFISFGILSFNESRDFKLVKNIEVFSNLLRELNYFYVDDTDPEKMIKTGIDAMLKTLDPYTVYIPESELEDFNFMTTGQYGGVGSLIRRSNDYIVISEVYKGFPADNAGLKAGDLIVEINGESTKNLNTTKVSELMKGTPDSEIKITVQRYNVEEYITKTIIRKKISIPSVPYYGMINEETAYIRLSGFTKNASGEVRTAMLNLKKNHHPSSLILDLRGNPGGLLVEAVKIANLFVDKGQEVVSTKGKVKEYFQSYKTPDQPIDKNIALAVIVDRGSASASEIVAGAIQDLDRGVIVGERTYGKGLVQTTRPLGYNNQLKVTTAKYYIPSGRCIQALDYSHRNKDGSVGHIPDSLISEFKTQNGRKVYDGGGIAPDIKVGPADASSLTIQLYTQFLFFDYATKYASTNETIPAIDEYVFSDTDFEDFKSFVKGKNFHYENRSSIVLQDLVKQIKKDKKYELTSTDLEDLEKKLSPNVDTDLDKNKKEIIEFLTTEIIGRYYYQAGGIKSTLKWDDDVKKAIQVLSDDEQYTSTLHVPDKKVVAASN